MIPAYLYNLITTRVWGTVGVEEVRVWTAEGGSMAALELEVEVLDSHGAPLHQVQHGDLERYVVARPGKYTVRARHNHVRTKMKIKMAVDGKGCGESFVSANLLYLERVVSWWCFSREHAGCAPVGDKTGIMDHLHRVQTRVHDRKKPATSRVRSSWGLLPTLLPVAALGLGY